MIHTPPDRGRFGPLVGVLLYLVGYIVAALALSMVGGIVMSVLVSAGAVEPPDLAAVEGMMDVEGLIEGMGQWFFPLMILVCIYSIVYTWIFVRFIEGRSYWRLGAAFHEGWFAEFMRGVLIAAALLAVIFVIYIATGTFEVHGFARPAPPDQGVLAYLFIVMLMFIFVGYYEELMFRGYVLQRLEERTGRLVAVLISSLIFGFMHFANPGAGVVGIFNTWVIGILLCGLYYQRQSLWRPVGFHVAWNFLLSYVISVPVSGFPLYGILDLTEVEGEGVLSGGSYGPEGDLLTTLIMAGLGVWLLFRRMRPRSTEERDL